MDDEVLNLSAPTIAEVTVKGPGISITRPADEAMMSKIIAILFGAAPAARGGGVGGGGGGVGGGGGGVGGGGGGVGGGGGGVGGQQPSQWDEDMTLGEFIVETGARTFQQKICAAGYYLTRRGAESFDRDEVRAALANAQEDMPTNLGRDFRDAASKNLIGGKHGEAGRFIIPRTGRTAVESHFQDVPKRRNTRKTAKKANSKGNAE